MEMIKSTVGKLVMSSAVKYNRLSDLIAKSYAGSECTELNIYIDLNSIIKKMYSIDRSEYSFKDQYELSSSVINLCGHYREFFKHMEVNTNIYIIHGLNCPSMNDTYVKGYNDKFISNYVKKKDITELINKNIKTLKILCQYLPKIYFFDIGLNETSAMIDYIITKLNPIEKGIENLVISKDILMLQLVSMYNVRVLRPIKGKDGDESFIVDASTLWNYYCTMYRKCNIPKNIIPTQFFPNVLIMTRVPERGLYSVFTVQKCFNFINAGIGIGLLKPDKNYDQTMMNNILECMDIPCNKVELEMRYRAINTRYQSQYILLLEKPDLKYLRLIDLEDPKSLDEIANKYFVNDPIDLERLKL